MTAFVSSISADLSSGASFAPPLFCSARPPFSSLGLRLTAPLIFFFAFRRALFSEKREFIYCLSAHGGLLFSGSGDGMLLCHDINAGSLLWGLGASSAGAVRAVGVFGSHLVAAGDDGKALAFSFSSN